MRRFSLTPARLFALALLIAFWWPSLVVAQAPRDYTIDRLDHRYIDEATRFFVEVTVRNAGGDATAESTIRVLLVTDGNEQALTETALRPLSGGESETLQFVFNTADFPAGSTQTIRVEAGLDAFETPGTNIADDNTAEVNILIPGIIGAPTPVTNGPQTDAPGASEADFVIPVLDWPVRLTGDALILNERNIPWEQVALGAAAVLTAVVLLWLLSVMLRLIFSRPPRLGAWYPPYGNARPLDPNSTIGRRQGWQQHAQNGSILVACQEQIVHPIKLLLGYDGRSLSGWRVTGMRLSQYDMYGRISRTVTLMPNKTVKALNRLIRQRDKLNLEKLTQRCRPIARQMVRAFRGKLQTRTAALPIALDVRFVGEHGEVRIIFELYQCQGYSWQRLDQWEPEITSPGHTFQENYTYTIHGQGDEKMRDFRRRLQTDIEWLLVETLRERSAPHERASTVPPDTLTGMQAISDNQI